MIVNARPKEVWTEVFHFSQGGDREVYGDRIPFLSVNNKGYFHFSSAVNWNKNWTWDYYFQYKKKYHIVIQQIRNTYQIWINGRCVYSRYNRGAMNFNNVKLYATERRAHPFHDGYGRLENLKWTDDV